MKKFNFKGSGELLTREQLKKVIGGNDYGDCKDDCTTHSDCPAHHSCLSGQKICSFNEEDGTFTKAKGCIAH
jgi:hypothetical protein